MTREEAIKELEILKVFDAPDLNDAIKMAISALRQQDVTDTDVGKNEPLTPDELRDIPCDPVYIVAGCVSWWDIVDFGGLNSLYLKVEGSLPFKDYGKNWLAYRHKPEE